MESLITALLLKAVITFSLVRGTAVPLLKSIPAVSPKYQISACILERGQLVTGKLNPNFCAGALRTPEIKRRIRNIF
jgi:hypothetical protein